MAFSNAERKRAARLRAKRKAGRPLSDVDDRWLRQYEAVVGRSRRTADAATKKDRDRAYRLRKRRRAGKTLKRADHNWLRRYDAARNRPRITVKVRSAREDAVRLVLALRDWLTPEMEPPWTSRRLPPPPKFDDDGQPIQKLGIVSYWQRKFTIAIAQIVDDEPSEPMIADAEAPDTWPVSTGHRAAVRAYLFFEDDRRPAWVSVAALTDDWADLAADVLAAIRDIMERYQAEGVAGWSVIVTP